MKSITLICQRNGHKFDIDEDEMNEKLIGGISWCPVRITIKGVEQDCGGLVVWKRGKK